MSALVHIFSNVRSVFAMPGQKFPNLFNNDVRLSTLPMDDSCENHWHVCTLVWLAVVTCVFNWKHVVECDNPTHDTPTHDTPKLCNEQAEIDGNASKNVASRSSSSLKHFRTEMCLFMIAANQCRNVSAHTCCKISNQLQSASTHSQTL